MFVFLFLCIYTNPATGCYMNKTILCVWLSNISNDMEPHAAYLWQLSIL